MPVDKRRDVTVVVPTVGRPSLERLLDALAAQSWAPAAVVVVDDRRPPAAPLTIPPALIDRTTVASSGGRGPAAARNVGWSAATSDWVVFLDDDVVPTAEWSVDLRRDVDAAPDVGAVQGRIRVPRPSGRALTDAERNTAALESAEWITADLAVRTAALRDVAGFDERFPRAYREDSDFARRAQAAGWRFVLGTRVTDHPLRRDPWWSSIPAQRGNRDDALMRALHGRDWSPIRGRRRRHLAITGAGVVAVVSMLFGRRRIAALAAACWAAGTTELAAARLRGGPGGSTEVAAMLVTSIAIPPAAVWHWSCGRLRWPARSTPPWPAEP